jgi:hypothetical protein
MSLDDLEAARPALKALGYEHDPAKDPGLPARFVLRDERGRQVDLHPLQFDPRGDGWQQLSETGKAWGTIPRLTFGRAEGSVAAKFHVSVQGFSSGSTWATSGASARNMTSDFWPSVRPAVTAFKRIASPPPPFRKLRSRTAQGLRPSSRA